MQPYHPEQNTENVPACAAKKPFPSGHEYDVVSASLRNMPDRRSSASVIRVDNPPAAPSSSRISDVLSRTGHDLHAPITPDGKTMLHWAAMHGKIEMLQILLAQDLDVDARTYDSYTPLHLAAENGQTAAVELLIAHGADLMALTGDERTPLYLAVRKRANGVIDCLLANGVDINAPIVRGMSLLHRAASEGMWSVMETLLECGADINAQTPEGYTALWYAVHCGYAPMVDLLLMRGAVMETSRPTGSDVQQTRRTLAQTLPGLPIFRDYSKPIVAALLLIWAYLLLHGCRL